MKDMFPKRIRNPQPKGAFVPTLSSPALILVLEGVLGNLKRTKRGCNPLPPTLGKTYEVGGENPIPARKITKLAVLVFNLFNKY